MPTIKLLHKRNIIRSAILRALGFLIVLGVLVWMAMSRQGYEPPSRWITIPMRVTAYCPCEICCGEFADGITAAGFPIGRGTKLIAAPPEYPFGTTMKVPGYGIAPVLDRGGAIKGDKIDLLFQSHQQALNWGVQYLDVKVLLEEELEIE